MDAIPFTPGVTVTVSASGTTASGAINSAAGQIMVFNGGTTLGFYRTSSGASTAVITDTPIPAGAILVFTKPVGHDTFSCILASGTASVYVTSGNGT